MRVPQPFVVLCAVLLSPVLIASARAEMRHPEGVPSDYVFRRHGWFHPSCVIRVGEDESIAADRTVRGPDGKIRRTIEPCGHMRYQRGGRPHLAPAADGAVLPPHAYDGYIGRYGYDGNVAAGPKVVTEWPVPPSPKKVTSQDIAFFNDLLTTADGGTILQPVLDFNGGKWTLESEHCCINGNDMFVAGVTVAVGDLIRGTVSGTGCSSSGCSSWKVVTEDVTSGKSVTLNTTAPGGAINGIGAASLESYDVTSCDMLPGGGQITFANHTVTDANGAALNYTYRLSLLLGTDAELPKNCGYAGMVSGNNYTLIWGPTTGTGGASGTGGRAGTGGNMGAGGAGTGGRAGTGGNTGTGGAATGGRAGTGGNVGTGGNTTGSGGSTSSGGATSSGGRSASGGASSSGGAPSSGGAIGSGGQTSSSGGAVGSGGLSASGGAPSTTGGAGGGPGATGDDGSGCACAVGGQSSGGLSVLFVAFALIAISRTRRRQRRTPPN